LVEWHLLPLVELQHHQVEWEQKPGENRVISPLQLLQEHRKISDHLFRSIAYGLHLPILPCHGKATWDSPPASVASQQALEDALSWCSLFRFAGIGQFTPSLTMELARKCSSHAIAAWPLRALNKEFHDAITKQEVQFSSAIEIRQW